MYDFTRETQGNVTYLVLRLRAEDILDEMALGMMINNKIPGLLPVTKRWEKQGFALYYPISSLTPLNHCAGLFADERRMTQLLRSFCRILIESEEYLLEQTCMLLDPEYVFVRAATGDLEILYLPLLNTQPGPSPKAFLNQLIANAARQLPQDGRLINPLLREGFQEKLNPAELLSRLDNLHQDEPRAVRAPQPAPPAQPAPVPAPAQQPEQNPVRKSETDAAVCELDNGRPGEQAEEKKRGLFGFGIKSAKKDPPKKEPTKKGKTKKRAAFLSDEGCDNPFTADGKIKPRGPVSAPPVQEEQGAEQELESRKSGMGAFLGLGGKPRGKKRKAGAEEDNVDSPFAPAPDIAAVPPASAVSQPPLQPAVEQNPASAGSGYTVNLNSAQSAEPQRTVAMNLAGGERDEHPAGFPVVWLEEKTSGARVQISHDNFHVGRKLDGDDIVDYAVLTSTPYMGSDHCYFVCHGGQMYIVDNNSRNGTWVNGEKIAPGAEIPVEKGAEIRMADVTFLVR